MHKAAAPHRWYQVWRARPAAGPDPADLGTAFGMELSLGGLADEPPVAGSTQRRAATHWTQRLRLRRGRVG